MSEKVHYFSWPLGRAFTFDEWCAYLKDRDKRGESTNEAVAEFGGWKFNVNGCCLNRRRAVDKHIGRAGGGFQVDVFQAPKGRKIGEPLVWNFNAWRQDGEGGGTAGWGEVDGDENDAIVAGLDAIAKRFDKDAEWYGSRKTRAEICKAGALMAREEIVERSQLTLF